MLLFIIHILGRFLSLTPEWALKIITTILGRALYILFISRRRMMISNLHHAFPHKPIKWHKKTALTSIQRTIETGIFVLISQYLSKEEINKRFSVSLELINLIQEHKANPFPILALVPHLNLMEAITLMPACNNGIKIPETGVIYRPFFNPSIEKWVKATRERFGIKLLSRKKGFVDSLGILKRNGTVAILFDQNAGHKGTLSLFFNRIASTTDLPHILATKFNPKTIALYTKRTGFMRAQICMEEIPSPITQGMNDWLQGIMTQNENICADWLWLHKRWRTQDEPHLRLQIVEKRSSLPDILPRSTRFFIRMPNWLGDVVMTLPLIRAIRASRQDASITLIASPSFIPLLQKLNLAEDFIALPPKGLSYFKYFFQYRSRFPDTAIQFTNSTRSDIESFIIGAPQRFGIQRPGKKRQLLTHSWKIPSTINESEVHQTHLWETYLKHFGLNAEIDYSPFSNIFPTPKTNIQSIGLICGTENSPEKRWPVESWRELISSLIKEFPDIQITLYGTPRDKVITQAVAKELPVKDRAGATTLLDFAQALTHSTLIICNDTGGMHLANALGTPTISIFGPTNPIRTGPIFNSYKKIIQPANCPSTGGSAISNIKPTDVFEVARKFIIQA